MTVKNDSVATANPSIVDDLSPYEISLVDDGNEPVEQVAPEGSRQTQLARGFSEEKMRRIKMGELLHNCHGERRGWRNRHVVLTERELIFLKPNASDSGADVLLDRIPLHIIDSVGRDEPDLFDVADKVAHIFMVRFVDTENKCRRPFRLQAASNADLVDWIEVINEHARGEKARMDALAHENTTGARHWLEQRTVVRQFYNSAKVQMFFGFFILLSWVVAVIDAEFSPNAHSSEAGRIVRNFIKVVETLLAVVFTIELGVNLFGNWFWPFFQNRWNVFDLVIVVVSFVSLAVEETPFFGMLRLVRVFKLIRLIKEHVQALNSILGVK